MINKTSADHCGAGAVDVPANTSISEVLNSLDIVKAMAPERVENAPLWETDPDLINPFAALPELQTWCEIGGRKALPKQGVVTLAAKQKCGKSYGTYVFALALLSGKPFDTIKPLDTPRRVLVFDMEMSRITLTNRVRSVVEAIGENANRFAVCSLKALPSDKWREIIATKIATYKPDIVVIDQAAKLVTDINNPVEADELTKWLEGMAIDRTVIAVIHENKATTDSNPRGHVGTYLLHASTERYSVSRKDGIFTITFVEGRDTDSEGAADVTFTLDAQGKILSAADVVRAAKDEERERWVKNMQHVFGEDKELRRCDIIRRLQAKNNLDEGAAKNAFENAFNCGAIAKTSRSHTAPYFVVDFM